MKRWLVPVVFLLVGIVFMLSRLEKAMVFFPTVYPEGNWQPASLPFKDVWFESEDGTKLHGWWIEKQGATINLLYCHGNAGNLSDRVGALETLHRQLAANILIFDYRGYGRSEGTPDGEAIVRDGLAAFAKMQSLGPGQPPYVLGRSLGGAVATRIAAETNPAGLILENTFSSLPDVAKVHYPWLPARLIMRHPLDSAAVIADFKGPLLQSHADRDQIVPYDVGERLFKAASEPKQWFRHTGLGHNDLASQEYFDTLREFVDQ